MGRKDKPVVLEITGDRAIGKQMRQSRQQKGISLTEMARRLGYSVSYLSGVENCYVSPSSRLIDDYEKVLEFRISEISSSIQQSKPNILVSDVDYLNLLQQGVSSWNKWRQENPHEHPSLVSADLSQANLCAINFNQTILHRADLSEANLSGADLSGADLTKALLSGADLSEADLSGAILGWTTFGDSDL